MFVRPSRRSSAREGAATRRRTRTLSVLCLLALATTVLDACVLFPGYSQTRVRFGSEGNELYGTLVLPLDRPGPHPIAIFVHGDGPLEHDAFGYFDLLWSALAERGVGSFAWDKPGVGGSEGEWLAQDMDQRAAEVVAAFEHLSRLEEVAAERVGLIGFSQAGWVLPRLGGEEWVRYMVFVSTAIDWIEQGDYLLRKRLGAAGWEEAAVRRKVVLDRRIDELLLSGEGDYESYLRLAEAGGEEPMSEERFEFVRKNVAEDARDYLERIEVPVLGLFGKEDLNVDVENSVEVYREAFGRKGVAFDYRVFPEATHQLTKARYFNDQTPGVLAVLKINVLGEQVFAEGVLNELGDFVERYSFR